MNSSDKDRILKKALGDKLHKEYLNLQNPVIDSGFSEGIINSLHKHQQERKIFNIGDFFNYITNLQYSTIKISCIILICIFSLFYFINSKLKEDNTKNYKSLHSLKLHIPSINKESDWLINSYYISISGQNSSLWQEKNIFTDF